MSDEQPPAKPTVSLPVVPQWAIELTAATKEGFRLTNANLEVVANDLGVLKQRVSIIEGLRLADDVRASKLSGGVRGLSNASLENDAQLAQERAAREALAGEVADLKKTNETQLAILGRLDKVASNPLVKTVMAMVATALLTWLASKGIQVPR